MSMVIIKSSSATAVRVDLHIQGIRIKMTPHWPEVNSSPHGGSAAEQSSSAADGSSCG